MTEPDSIGSLDWETFEANWSAIAIDVRTILAAKGRTRRRFRVITLYEKATGEWVGEILRTSFGPVVVMRAAELDLERPAKGGISVGFRLARGPDRLTFQPFTGDANDMYQLRSRSKHYPAFCDYFVDRDYPGGELVIR